MPPKVEYFLTDMGKSILPIVNDIWRWGKENMRYYYEKFLEKDRLVSSEKKPDRPAVPVSPSIRGCKAYPPSPVMPIRGMK
jgi:hypothetical protein